MANDDWAAAVDLQEGIRNVEVGEDAEEPTKGEQSFLCKGIAIKNLLFNQKKSFRKLRKFKFEKMRKLNFENFWKNV